jgi:hypothetical protein
MSYNWKADDFMGKRDDFMLFPDGKRRALTLSYDDGVVQDRKLCALLTKYGVKCTFNLGADVLGYKGRASFGGKEINISKIEPEEVKTLYAGQEIGGHGLYHSFLNNIGTSTAMYEVIEDRRKLETYSGKMVRFFAYPFGTYNEDVKTILRLAGYVGARTVRSTHTFDIPEDFLEWDPTCHHDDPELMSLAKEFCEGHAYTSRLFYLWGHAYEFDANDNWSVLEDFLKYIEQFKDNIWFAGNCEIADYITAFGQRIYSADGSLVCNPTATDIWLQVRGTEYKIAAGKTVKIDDPGL